MKCFKKSVCIILAVLIALTMASCSSNNAVFIKQADPVNLSQPQERAREQREKDIFVSPDGDDNNDGTEQNPVKTVERALELSKDFSSQEEEVIYFSAGEYSVNSLNLTDEYKNTVFYADDEVIFNGGVTLNLSDFSDYKDNIKMLDLKAYGVTQEQIGQIRAFGAYNTAENMMSQAVFTVNCFVTESE